GVCNHRGLVSLERIALAAAHPRQLAPRLATVKLLPDFARLRHERERRHRRREVWARDGHRRDVRWRRARERSARGRLVGDDAVRAYLCVARDARVNEESPPDGVELSAVESESCHAPYGYVTRARGYGV